MKSLTSKALALTAAFFLLTAFSGAKKPASSATPTVGQMAPDFEGKLNTGESVKLSSLKGEYVVLEWLNHGCPYVRKHYDSGNMQKVQAEVKKRGAKWYSIVSAAEGKQGYMDAKQATRSIEKEGAKVDGIILDPEGKIGQLYTAATTPQMVIIDPKGQLAYYGAIDSVPSVDKDDLKTAKNFVLAAFANFDQQKVADPARTEPYGCGIKYKN